MAKYEFLQSRFTEGVLAQTLQGRSDEEFYRFGLKGAQNMIPLLEGPCTKRPGTVYLGQAKTADAISGGVYTTSSVFVRFFKDVSNAYIIELGYSVGSTFTFTANATTEKITTSSAHGLAINDTMVFTTAGTLPAGLSLNTTYYVKTVPATNELTLSLTQGGSEVNITGTGSGIHTLKEGGPYLRLWSQDRLLNNKVSPSAGIYQNTSHPWTADQIKKLKWTQSGDVIFFTCPDKKPYTLTRTILSTGTGATYAEDGSKWDFAEYVMEDGPYNPINYYDTEVNSTNKLTLKFHTEPSSPVKIGRVQFNTLTNSFVYAGHGLQIGQKIRLNGGNESGETWGNLRKPNNQDDSSSAQQALIVADETDTGWKTNGLDFYVIGTDATSFTVSTEDSGDVFEFELKTGTTTDPITKSEAKVTVWRYVYPKDATTERQLTVKNNDSAQAGHFTASDIGRMIRINPLARPDKNKGGIRWAWGFISHADVSNSFIKVKFHTEVSNTRGTMGTHEFRLGTFSDGEGWPQIAQIYQQRMVLAASTKNPSTVWLSRIADFYTYSPTEILMQDSPTVVANGIATELITDSNALSFTLDSDTLDEIKWIAESKKLMLGTSAGIYMLYGSETNLSLTPFRYTINKESSFSATSIEPIVVSNALIYSQTGGKEIQELQFQGSEDQWFSSKISMKAYDLIRSTSMVKMVWQERPHQILWMQMSDGRLLSLSYDRQLSFQAWAEHTLGGTNAKVEDIDILSKDDHDQLWIKVKRDNHTLPYVEILSRYPSENILTRDKMVFSDSSITKTSLSGTTAISGLTHLEGDSASIYYDGMEHTPKTVSSGALTLEISTGSTAVIGLSYDANIETLSPTYPPNQFSYTRRLLTLALSIQESLGIKVEFNDSDEEILFRSTQDNMGEQIDLFTGMRKLTLSGIGWDVHTLKVLSNGPFPMQINALAVEVETGGI